MEHNKGVLEGLYAQKIPLLVVTPIKVHSCCKYLLVTYYILID